MFQDSGNDVFLCVAEEQGWWTLFNILFSKKSDNYKAKKERRGGRPGRDQTNKMVKSRHQGTWNWVARGERLLSRSRTLERQERETCAFDEWKWGGCPIGISSTEIGKIWEAWKLTVLLVGTLTMNQIYRCCRGFIADVFFPPHIPPLFLPIDIKHTQRPCWFFILERF